MLHSWDKGFDACYTHGVRVLMHATLIGPGLGCMLHSCDKGFDACYTHGTRARMHATLMG